MQTLTYFRQFLGKILLILILLLPGSPCSAQGMASWKGRDMHSTVILVLDKREEKAYLTNAAAADPKANYKYRAKQGVERILARL